MGSLKYLTKFTGFYCWQGIISWLINRCANVCAKCESLLFCPLPRDR